MNGLGSYFGDELRLTPNVSGRADLPPPADPGFQLFGQLPGFVQLGGPLNQPFGELKPYERSPTQKVADLGVEGLTALGADPYQARHVAEGVVNTAMLHPVIGTLMGAAELGHANTQGDTLGMLAAAPAAIPAGGSVLKQFAKGAANEARPAITQAAQAFNTPQTLPVTRPTAQLPPSTARASLPPQISQVADAATSPGGALATAVREGGTGRAPAITAVSLRDKPLDEAIKIASTEQHLIPKPNGGYVGAPHGVQDAAGIQAMRDSFDEAVLIGAGIKGDQWYKLARELVQEIAPNNPLEQRQLAQGLGLFSAQANPDTNLGFMLQARNAYQTGQPRSLVRTGAQASKYNTARETGGDIPLGRKTEIYGINLDPNQPWTTTGTNDIWHARAFGFTNPKTGKPWDAALGPQQHAFLDAETVLAVKRANEMKLGGRTDWTAPEIQAASWVGRKAQGLLGKKRTPDMASALAEAAQGYTEALPKYTAYGTAEATPGKGIGHLEAVASGPADLRERFAADPRSSYAPGGRDLYHEGVGLYQRDTVPTTGVFEGPSGLEVNPGEAARPLVSYSGKSGERAWDKPSEELLRGAEATKAYVGAQNMGAASGLVPTNKPGRLSSYQFPTGGQWTPQQVQGVQDIGAKYGVPSAVHYGDQAVLTNWEGRKGLARAEEQGLGDELAKFLGTEPGQRTEMLATSVDYGPKWLAGEGSGEATRELQRNLNPTMIANLDASPAIREHVAGLIDRDIEFAAQTGSPLRADLQTARDIIVNEGFAGLFRALDAGKVALPALAGVMALLPQLVPQQQGAEPGM